MHNPTYSRGILKVLERSPQPWHLFRGVHMLSMVIGLLCAWQSVVDSSKPGEQGNLVMATRLPSGNTCCTVLVLYCTVLSCTALYCTVLCRTLLYRTVLC